MRPASRILNLLFSIIAASPQAERTAGAPWKEKDVSSPHGPFAEV
jgi:hypothetical protein